MSTIKQAWQTLGLKPGADLKAVKQAYRELVQQWHPDRFVGNESAIKQADEKIKEINQAYALVKQQLLEAPPSSKVRLKTEQTQSEFYYQEGVFLAELEEYEDAIAHFTQAIKLDSNYLKAYQYRAFLYEKLGSTYRADADFLKIEQIKLQQRIYSQWTEVKSPKRESAPEPSTDSTSGEEDTDSDRWQHLHTLAGHNDAVSSCAMGDRGLVISGSHDRTLKLWNLKTGELLKSIVAHGDRINAVALSANGKSFASASQDGTMKTWKIGRGQVTQSTEIKAHKAPITCLLLSGNGQFLVSGARDKTVKIWNTQTGRLLKTLRGYSAHLSDLAWFADGQNFASSALEPLLRMRQLPYGKLVHSLQSPCAISALAFSPDGLTLAAGGCDRKIHVWQLSDYTKLWSVNHGDRISALTFSPHQPLLASGGEDKAIKLWHRETGELLGTIRDHHGAITALQFLAHPKSSILLSSSEDRTLKVWRLNRAISHPISVTEVVW